MEKEQLVSLVTKAQQGDNVAKNKLFNTYYNDLYYFALKTVKEEDLARDITQEAVLEIISTLSDLKEPAAFVTWAKQITYHQCTRYFKKKKDVLVDEDEDGNTIFDDLKEENTEFIPDAALDKSDFKGTILAILDELPEEQRSATMMYYFDEMSIREIAEIQGVSEGTIKSRLNYGRKAIKNSVEKYQEENGVKLYSTAVAPLFKWVFEDFYGGGMEPTYAERMAREISNATGSVLSVDPDEEDNEVESELENEATTTTNDNVVKAPRPVMRKILFAASLVAAMVVGGIITANILPKNDGDKTDIQGVVSQIEDDTNSQDSNTVSTNQSEQVSSNDKKLDYAAIIDSFVPSALNTFELYIGDTHAPNATVWLKNGKGSVYTSNEDVVTINDLGKVTAVGEGKAYVIIGAMNNSMYEIYRYDVYAKAPEANLSNLPEIEDVNFLQEIENFESTALNTRELKVGETHTPTAAVLVKSGEQCFTSDASVVTVSENGTVIAQGRGTAYVVIKSDIGVMFQIYKYIVK